MKINIDFLNTLLILIALLLAFLFPIEVFLIAYATLGPLHYLTEIKWIKSQDYFVKSNRFWIYLSLLFAFIFCLPYLFSLYKLIPNMDHHFFDTWGSLGKSYINWVLSSALVIAFSMLLIKNNLYRTIVIICGIIFSIILNIVSSSYAYNLWVGIFLPTLIHVYIFTGLFMIYGTLKTNRKMGWLNVSLLLLIPFVIWLAPVNPVDFLTSEKVKTIFTQNNFHHLNVHLGELLGVKKQPKFFFYEVIDFKLQIFIAFAYFYHYLNWFSKTTIIGWHKNLTTRSTSLIIILWLVFVSLYAIDYRLGFTVSLFISVLHVILEFPVNVLSIKEISKRALMVFTK